MATTALTSNESRLRQEIDELLKKLKNPQQNNVGNVGDRPKRDVLPALADVLLSHTSTCVYVELFAFLLEGPKPPPYAGTYR
jgi:hypothetical protein